MLRLCPSYLSLPQWGINGEARCELCNVVDDAGKVVPHADRCLNAMFGKGLEVMGLCYASIAGTAVLQLKDVPPRPAAFDGRIVLYAVHSAGDTEEQHASKAEALRAELVERFGAVDEMKRVGENLHMRFAAHDAAERCIKALRTEHRAIASEYNTTAYDRVSADAPHHKGHYSGWVVCSNRTRVTVDASALLHRCRTRCCIADAVFDLRTAVHV